MFFSFSTLNILACCFWTLNFLVRNLVITLLRLPYMWSVAFFFFSTFNTLWLWSLAFKYLITMSWCGAHVSWSSLSFLDVWCLLSNLGHFQTLFFHIIFHPFFSLFSFWNSHSVYVNLLDGVLQGLWDSAHFNLFSFHSSDPVISTVLSSSLMLILSFACSILPLKPYSKFLNFSYCTFQLKNFLLVSF